MKHHYINQLIQFALEEDIGPGDITTDHLVEANKKGKGIIFAKEPLRIAGLEIAKSVFTHLDASVSFVDHCTDGNDLTIGQTALEIHGSLRTLLTGERTALNFLQRLSGIATHVRSYCQAISNSQVRLVDTRKTTPGWRILEKYAVRVGGGYNHRMGLYDGILIKDNHIAVSGGIRPAIEKIRKHMMHLLKIEIEVSSLAQVKEALDAKADVIMLDNMTIDEIREAVKLINGQALVEVSGGVTKDNLALLAKTGVDIISSGSLTHSARSVDLSMDISPAV